VLEQAGEIESVDCVRSRLITYKAEHGILPGEKLGLSFPRKRIDAKTGDRQQKASL
jgi:hypothetical protein